MTEDKSTVHDLKLRFNGLLENPYVSKIQTGLLDGFKVNKFKKIISDVNIGNLIDVGCGLGQNSVFKQKKFIGVDNSFPRVKFAARSYKDSIFIQADAVKLPFKMKSFDSVLFIDTIHHLSDEELKNGVKEMIRIAGKYLIIDDAVLYEGQSKFSKFLYNIDRGRMYRTDIQIMDLLKQFNELKLIVKNSYKSFPGFYKHVVFIYEINK